MMSDPVLLTIILNYKTPDMTLRSAEAVLKEMDGINGSLVIVDNDSNDGSYEALSEALQKRGWLAPRVRLVKSPKNGGFGAGNNFGIQHGMALEIPDYIYILNSDAFPDQGAIKTLITHMEHHPKTGIAGSYIHGPNGEPHLTAFRFPSIQGELEGAARVGAISRLFSKHIVPLPIPKSTMQVDWLAGASMMIRRGVLEQIGGFDESFFLYFEETDLCLRAAKAGWKTQYVRDSHVTHIGSVSTGMKNWVRMPQYWFDSRQYYFRANHGKTYVKLATIAHITGALIWKLRRLVGRKPRRDPEFFLRDLITHALHSPVHDIRHIPKLPTSTQPLTTGEPT